jgi:hypothetical protein
MWPSSGIVAGLISLLSFMAVHAQAKDGCELESLLHQQRDEATIQRLEGSWNFAIWQGDSGLERCLLTADFGEILSTGELKTLTDELGFTAKNKGQNRPPPALPPITVLLHGNVAVAYAIWVPTAANRKPDRTADYFVWENGFWHVFFSQSTPVEDSSAQVSSTTQYFPRLRP